MARVGNLTVVIRAVKSPSEGDAALALAEAFKEATYRAATAQAAFTRFSRATWPLLSRWERFKLTLRRKGW